MSCEIDQGKKQVSKFPGEGRSTTFRLANLLYLFPDFRWDAFLRIRPIKSNPRCAFLEILGQKKGWKTHRNAIQCALAGWFFRLLKLMPPVENLLSRDKSFFTKYVGVPTDEFLGEM